MGVAISTHKSEALPDTWGRNFTADPGGCPPFVSAMLTVFLLLAAASLCRTGAHASNVGVTNTYVCKVCVGSTFGICKASSGSCSSENSDTGCPPGTSQCTGDDRIALSDPGSVDPETAQQCA